MSTTARWLLSALLALLLSASWLLDVPDELDAAQRTASASRDIEARP